MKKFLSKKETREELRKLRPLGDWIFCEVLLEPKSRGLLIKPEEYRDKTYLAKVLAVGDDEESLSEGNTVILQPDMAEPIRIDSSMYAFFNEKEVFVKAKKSDILAVVEGDEHDRDVPEGGL